jgi:ribosomal protein S18 acetylase RimI-like enzyme
MASTYDIRSLTEEDSPFVRRFMVEHWGGEEIVVHKTVYHPDELPGFAVVWEGEIAGLITYQMQENSCEIVTLNSLQPNQGIGLALIKKVETAARDKGCARLRLVTTNDNLNALGFYQRHGFRLTAIDVGAVNESRKLKPGIPLVGENGIPINDEIMFEKEIPVDSATTKNIG